MLRCFAILAHFAAAACGNSEAADSVPADSNAAAPASSTSAQGSGTPGRTLRVLINAPCHKYGSGASDEPWEVKQGSTVTWLGADGAYTRIETAPGLPCRIASEAVIPK